MPTPKIIASDLDGTLLGSRGFLSERTANALRSAREHGIAVVAVTARPPRVFDEWSLLPSLLDAAICSNGAIVYAPGDRVVTASRTLEPETAAAAWKALKAALPGVKMAVETGFEVVAERGYAKVDSVGDNRVFVADAHTAFASASQIAKLLVHHEHVPADTLLETARAAGLTGVELSHSGGLGLLEVSAAGVSKATVLADWCARRGAVASEVIAFGDMPNDVPMLRWAGRSFAVANAHPEARAAATDQCAANTADGVAEVIERLA